MTEQGPITKKLIRLGVAIAIPLAAVALYFAVFDQPKISATMPLYQSTDSL